MVGSFSSKNARNQYKRQKETREGKQKEGSGDVFKC